MEVEFDFAIDDAADSFDEATRFVIGLALTLDLVERRSGEDRERALVDDLIAAVPRFPSV